MGRDFRLCLPQKGSFIGEGCRFLPERTGKQGHCVTSYYQPVLPRSQPDRPKLRSETSKLPTHWDLFYELERHGISGVDILSSPSSTVIIMDGRPYRYSYITQCVCFTYHLPTIYHRNNILT